MCKSSMVLVAVLVLACSAPGEEAETWQAPDRNRQPLFSLHVRRRCALPGRVNRLSELTGFRISRAKRAKKLSFSST